MADKTAAQLAREDMESLEQWAKENGADDRSLMILAKDIQQRCAAGVLSERVSNKSEAGVVEVLERFPAVELSAISFIHKVLEDNRRRLEKTPPPDPTINIILSRQRLEETL